MKNTGQYASKSLEEQNIVIQKKYPYLTLLSYTSFEDYCEVKDTEYNETFTCRYKNLHYGRVNCPSRKKENRKNTLLEKYGVDNVCKISGNLEKVKATNVRKYGQDSYAKTTEFKKEQSDLWKSRSTEEKEVILKKTQATNIERHGCVNPMQNQAIKEKAIRTVKERYDVENVSYIPEVKKKLSESYYQNNMKEKLTEGLIANHGVTNPMLIPEVKEKVIFNSIQTKKDKGLIKYVFEGDTIPDLIQKNLVPFTYSHMRNLIIADPELDIFHLDKSYTDLERKVAGFLTDNNIDFLHDRSTIPTLKNKRPDFLIEDHKLIIECHGLYWHSELLGWTSTKVQKRREMFNEAGYRVISLYQDNIENSWHI
jgi:very-short-patch-repair endonuclease